MADSSWGISTPLAPGLEQAKNPVASSGNSNLSDYNNWNGDLQGYLRYMAENGSDSDYDRYINFLTDNWSIDKANAWTASREDSQYQRLVEDLRKAGINPYSLLNQGGSPASSSSATFSSSGAYASNESLKKEANSQKWLGLLTTLITSIIMAAAIAA